MTALMRAALQDALRGSLRRVHDSIEGKPPWPNGHHSATLYALVRHGLLERTETRSRNGHRTDLWTITDAGKQALKPRERRRVEPIWYPVRTDLAHANLPDDYDPEGTSNEAKGYTKNPDWAMHLTPCDPDQAAQPTSLARHVAARQEDHIQQEAKKLGRQVREAAVYAARQGLRDELDALRRAIADFDALRRRDAA